MVLTHGPQELISLFNKLEASMVATKLKRQLLPKVFNNGFDNYTSWVTQPCRNDTQIDYAKNA